jgi:hypothetical protein
MSRSYRNPTQYYSFLTNTNTLSGNHRYGQQPQQSQSQSQSQQQHQQQQHQTLQTSHVFTTQRKSSNLPPQTS